MEIVRMAQSPITASASSRRGLISRLAECILEARLPYAVTRALASPTAARIHRPLIDALLRFGARRKPLPISFERSRELHLRYPIRNGYKYDLAAKEARAAARFEELAKL